MVVALPLPTAMVRAPLVPPVATAVVVEATAPTWLAPTPWAKLIEIVLPTLAPTW